MSKLSQELRTLLYLNYRYSRSSFISVTEIAKHLEVSTRQARRYMEDLANLPGIIIETQLGRDGGYRLAKPLDKGIALPENLVLAMTIAMKRNKKVEEVLVSLPQYVITDVIEGDNSIDEMTYENLELLIAAMRDHRSVTFFYHDDPKTLYFVDPYQIVYTNKTYYLYAVHKDKLKHFDCAYMKDIKTLGGFKKNKAIEEEVLASLSRYGVKNEKKAVLRVKCADLDTLRRFDKYFEGKGVKNEEQGTYEVVGSDEHELYYPLFRISTKKYVFLDEEFKKNYIIYLRNQIRSIERSDI